jgi:hypothetical protein
MTKPNMVSKKIDGEWWVTRVPECGECGPYQSREEAEEHRIALANTFANWDNWSYWTTAPEPKK